jgi:hypothetical protein
MFDLKQIIDETFEKEVRRIFNTKPEIIKFLLNHPDLERKKEHDCRREIRVAEMSYGVKMDRMRLERIICAWTQVFCQVAFSIKEQQLISPAERERRIKEANRENYAAEAFQEMKKDGVVEDTLTHNTLGERDGEDTAAGA